MSKDILTEDALDGALDASIPLAERLGCDPARVARARVHLLWDDCSVEEALDAAATLNALGDVPEARAIVQAVLDQCTGLGCVPQRASNRPALD